jgi:hypothetical protein
LSQINLHQLIRCIFERSGIANKDFAKSCISFANSYHVILNEERLQNEINSNEASREEKLLFAFLMLIAVSLRLRGIAQLDISNSWIWASEGSARRKSMESFIKQMDDYVRQEKSLLDTFEWLFRDYVVAQHTITVLEKWRQRGVNTFHFSSESGVYEWLRMDWNTFTASRFNQAYSMLIDLGLVEFDNRIPHLTKTGKQTLGRVLEKVNG